MQAYDTNRTMSFENKKINWSNMSTLSFEGEVARNNQLSEDNCIALVGIFEIYTIAPGGPITTERYAKNPSLVDLSNNPAPGDS